MSTQVARPTAEAVQANLTEFLEARTKRPVASDLDLFASGLVSSLFAMELLVHIETSFRLTVPSTELRLDSFRTIDAMSSLVLRLAAAAHG